jgi:hypothetical protein
MLAVLSYRREKETDTVHIAVSKGTPFALCGCPNLEEVEQPMNKDAPEVPLCGRCMHGVIDYLGFPATVHKEMDERWADKRIPVPQKGSLPS